MNATALARIIHQGRRGQEPHAEFNQGNGSPTATYSSNVKRITVRWT
jgi:hypothetical protein